MGIHMASVKSLPERYQKQAAAKLERQTGKAVKLTNEKSKKNFRSRKYGSKKASLDGVVFDSKKEAEYYEYLKIRQAAGEISDLTLQPKFVLQKGFELNGKKYRPITYTADFSYYEGGVHYVVDTKGYRTDVYRLKKKLFLKKYGSQLMFMEK